MKSSFKLHKRDCDEDNNRLQRGGKFIQVSWVEFLLQNLGGIGSAKKEKKQSSPNKTY